MPTWPFYLWLRAQSIAGADPRRGPWHAGMAAGQIGRAVRTTCWPAALIRCNTPVIYPFIVNDPGEAAQAKRRIGAVTLGHVPPRDEGQATTPDQSAAARNPAGRVLQRGRAGSRNGATGCRTTSAPRRRPWGSRKTSASTRATSTAEAITRIDRFVCDIKESQFGDGLHIYGRVPVTETAFDSHAAALGERRRPDRRAEREARLPRGPSGSPYRGRRGRAAHRAQPVHHRPPRSVPTRAAHAQGVRLAEELVRRHLQEEWRLAAKAA